MVILTVTTATISAATRYDHFLILLFVVHWRMMNWKWFGSGCGLVDVSYRHIPELNEQSHKKDSTMTAGVPVEDLIGQF
jgi:hypothetical protein